MKEQYVRGGKMDITWPPDTDISVKFVFELRRTCPNYWRKKVLPA